MGNLNCGHWLGTGKYIWFEMSTPHRSSPHFLQLKHNLHEQMHHRRAGLFPSFDMLNYRLTTTSTSPCHFSQYLLIETTRSMPSQPVSEEKHSDLAIQRTQAMHCVCSHIDQRTPREYTLCEEF